MKDKALVAYFSASGATKKVAQVLAGAVSADLYEIKPEVTYTQEDLNWKNKNSRSSVEMSDLKSRPVLADNGILSKEKGTGPWSMSREYEANYGDEDIWQRFSAYKDTDGYYFIGNFKECSDDYERYAFHSYYDIEVSLNNSTIEVAKSYSYVR